jgi:PKD repeat protein
MKGGALLFSFFIVLFFGIQPCLAGGIRINEVAWMGTAESYADEWIELKNASGENIDVTGWKLVDKPDSLEEDRLQINLATTTIEKGGIFLLERTDQDTLPDIDGDQIYTGGLNNNGNDGKGLFLIDNEKNIVDKIEAKYDENKEKYKWPAGDNETKQTMIYCGGEWLSSPGPGGSPKEENSCPALDKTLNKEERSGQEASSDDYIQKGGEKENKSVKKKNEENKKNQENGRIKEREKQGELVMTEIFPNPVDNSGEEFIEFYNQGEKEVKLKGWKIKNDLGQEFVFGGIADRAAGIAGEVVKPEDHLVLFRKKTKLVLNDNGGMIKLFSPGSVSPEKILNYRQAEPGFSYASTNHINPDRLSTSTQKFFIYSKKIQNWAWSGRPTPRGFNQIHSKNRPPAPLFSFSGRRSAKNQVTFDASDSFDQDGDKLIYQWRFGDGVVVEDIISPTHSYLEAGEYQVTLFVSDGRETAELSKDIIIGEQDRDNRKKTKEKKEKADPQKEVEPADTGMVINEIYPAPAEGKKEWAELLNIGEKEINIADWQLENKNSSYRFPGNSKDISMDPQQIYLVKQDNDWLELQKEEDFVKLVDESGAVMDRVEYAQVFPGESLARGPGGKMFWTTVPTPGKENEISIKNSLQFNSVLSDMPAGNSRRTKNLFKDVPLAEARESLTEEKVRTKGVVAVRPGVLGEQYFYIVGSAGIQIYNFYKDFPELEVGDRIEVKGEISETRYEEKRINTKERADIQILGQLDPPEPIKTDCKEINKRDVGKLVQIRGKIVDKDSKKIYIGKNSDPVLVYLQEEFDISATDMKEGQEMEIVGLVSKFNNGVRVLPRSAQDINLIKSKENSLEIESDVAGASATSSEIDADQEEWALRSEKENNNAIIYLLIASGTVIAILIVLLYKKGNNG